MEKAPRILSFVIFCGITQPSLAVASNYEKSVVETLRGCSAETSDSRRLECYDQLSADLPLRASQAYGLTVHQGNAEVAAPSLTASVSRSYAQPGGKYTVELSNGQVWSTVLTEQNFTVQTGEYVTIIPGALGSYFLINAHQGRTRVRRTH
jgi:hypothetical protein